MKRVLIISLAVLYIYTLTFDIFLNKFFRIPTPIIFCIPLIILFKDQVKKFFYTREICVYTISLFGYYVIASDNVDAFIINIIVFSTAALYFNYFVGGSEPRFKYSVAMFFVFLLVSTIVMLANQFDKGIVALRELLIGAEVRQSPSGISSTIFNFGYQLAPLVTFIFIYACALKKNVVIILAVFIFSILSIYFGLQRSVLVSFVIAGLLFFIFYYKSKSIVVIAFALVLSFSLYNYALNSAADVGSDNILAKSERDGGVDSRDGLFAANLELITDYPYGLIFHGTTWSEVAKHYPAFAGGLTSHNAYLMFITYFGPFFGIGLLLLLYYPFVKLFNKVIIKGNIQNNILLTCLCLAFLAVSLNALFHNAWLLNTNGPTVFLYFSVLHLSKQSELVDFDQDNFS